MKPPSDKQRDFVDAICRELNILCPSEGRDTAQGCFLFIQAHKEEFDTRMEELRKAREAIRRKEYMRDCERRTERDLERAYYRDLKEYQKNHHLSDEEMGFRGRDNSGHNRSKWSYNHHSSYMSDEDADYYGLSADLFY